MTKHGLLFIKVFPHGFEPRSSESESEVLTVTPQENNKDTKHKKSPYWLRGHQVSNYQHIVIPADLALLQVTLYRSCFHNAIIKKVSLIAKQKHFYPCCW